MPSDSLRRPIRQGRGSHDPSRGEQESAARYIAQMTAELAAMAETAQLDLLTYFLKMAQMEAEAFLRDEE